MHNPSYTITLDAPKKKRGRPAKKIQPSIKVEKPVDFKALCQKLQEALAKAYVEAEELERVITHWRNEVGARDIVIRYLESKIK